MSIQYNQLRRFLQNPNEVSYFIKNKLFKDGLLTKFTNINHQGKGRPRSEFELQEAYSEDQWTDFPIDIQELLIEKGIRP